MAPHPDATLMDDRLSKIKPGGTLLGATTYVLTDESAPVGRIATTTDGDEIGRQTVEIQ